MLFEPKVPCLNLVTAKGNDCKPAAFGERSEGPKARPKFVLSEPKVPCLKLVTAKGNDCKPAAFGERSE